MFIKNSLIIAFDFGIKSIGIAIGQFITCTAQPLKTLKVIHGIPNWEKIYNILNEWQPDIIIVGLPLNINGLEQKITKLARNFAYNLEKKFGIKVILYDERYSTVEAREKIIKIKGYRYLYKAPIDSISAVIILEDWLFNFKYRV